jgi:hypothetical protein
VRLFALEARGPFWGRVPLSFVFWVFGWWVGGLFASVRTILLGFCGWMRLGRCRFLIADFGSVVGGAARWLDRGSLAVGASRWFHGQADAAPHLPRFPELALVVGEAAGCECATCHSEGPTPVVARCALARAGPGVVARGGGFSSRSCIVVGCGPPLDGAEFSTSAVAVGTDFLMRLIRT